MLTVVGSIELSFLRAWFLKDAESIAKKKHAYRVAGTTSREYFHCAIGETVSVCWR